MNRLFLLISLIVLAWPIFAIEAPQLPQWNIRGERMEAREGDESLRNLYTWNDGWDHTGRINFLYYASNPQVVSLQDQYQNGYWNAYQRIDRHFDELDRNWLYKIYQFGTSGWEINNATLSIYNDNGDISEMKYYDWWDSPTSYGAMFGRSEYIYQAGLLDQMLYFQVNQNIETLIIQNDYFYDNQGRISHIEQVSHSSTIDFYANIYYSYNDLGLLESIVYENSLDDIDYEPYYRYNYSYNALGQNDQIVVQMYVADDSGGIWQDYNRYLYSYNDLGQKIEYLRQARDQNGLWLNRDKESYEYLPSDIAEESLAPPAKLNVWPNPARDILNIKLPSAEVEYLSIFDLRGRLIRDLSEIRSTDVKWDGLDERGKRVGSGIYLIKAGNRQWQLHQRIVILN